LEEYSATHQNDPEKWRSAKKKGLKYVIGCGKKASVSKNVKGK